MHTALVSVACFYTASTCLLPSPIALVALPQAAYPRMLSLCNSPCVTLVHHQQCSMSRAYLELCLSLAFAQFCLKALFIDQQQQYAVWYGCVLGAVHPVCVNMAHQPIICHPLTPLGSKTFSQHVSSSSKVMQLLLHSMKVTLLFRINRQPCFSWMNAGVAWP